jgi:hypothetical protein
MRTNRRASPLVMLAATVVAAVALVQCGSSDSPSGPTSTVTVATVALSPTSVSAGGTAQGTVTLAAPATGASSILLSSSNSAIARVDTAATVQAGATTAAFTVTAVSAGTATITASLNGSSKQSPVLTVTAGPTLSSMSLGTSSVVGGNTLNGTVTLSGPAPTGGAVVSLSGSDPVVTVPASVTVPAGSTSATFTISTRAVGGTISATISGSYGGVSMSAALSVTPPTVATANFGVSGPSETETCTMSNGGNTLNCTFNGTTSTAPGTITAWDWTYTVATMFSQTTSGPVLTMPAVNCSFLPPPPLPAGASWFDLTVTLKIHDSLGNVSAEKVDSGARVLPQGVCGF